MINISVCDDVLKDTASVWFCGREVFVAGDGAVTGPPRL